MMKAVYVRLKNGETEVIATRNKIVYVKGALTARNLLGHLKVFWSDEVDHVEIREVE